MPHALSQTNANFESLDVCVCIGIYTEIRLLGKGPVRGKMRGIEDKMQVVWTGKGDNGEGRDKLGGRGRAG